ncbi:hypothetical protein [Persicobacter diffluens]|uniref:hypothetical protein n=1 Tax=Persicobacter diffluens TaxID=981 RepID=UPI0030C6D51D
MKISTNKAVEKTIYMGACGLVAYWIARRLKSKDASAFLFVGGLLGEILAE